MLSGYFHPINPWKMGISDTLNRRVRARPDDDEDAYSEGSDVSEEVLQREGAEDEDSDEDLQSQDVCDLAIC